MFSLTYISLKATINILVFVKIKLAMVLLEDWAGPPVSHHTVPAYELAEYQHHITVIKAKDIATTMYTVVLTQQPMPIMLYSFLNNAPMGSFISNGLSIDALLS